MSSHFTVTEVAPHEINFVDGPHDGEHFTIIPGFVCPLLPQVFEWPGEMNGEAGYNRYEAEETESTQWQEEFRVVRYRYIGFRTFNANRDLHP